MSEKRGIHKNVESGAFSANVEGVASRTPFSPIYIASVFLGRDLNSKTSNPAIYAPRQTDTSKIIYTTAPTPFRAWSITKYCSMSVSR